jgi:hypothetical protein
MNFLGFYRFCKVNQMKFFVLFSFLQLRANIHIGKLEEFSKLNKIALHFSCSESNMFATNCACHVKCTDPLCNNAVNICEKYHKS